MLVINLECPQLYNVPEIFDCHRIELIFLDFECD